MRIIGLLLLIFLLAACGQDEKKAEKPADKPAVESPATEETAEPDMDTSSYEAVPAMAHPADNPSSPEKVALGKMLYFDPRLSGDNSISCATCHHPDKGWGDGQPRAIGFGGKELGRHSPTVINSGYFAVQFWDGRAPSLEEQAKGPIQAPGEMNQNPEELVKELNAIPEYKEQFGKVFGESGITLDNIAKAIAAFERTVVSTNSPYDKYMAGDKSAMSASAVSGMNLFFGKAMCVVCHNGPVFTDSGFHNIGVKQQGPLKEDLGRFNVTKDPADKGAFKTPGLRSVSLSPPYMHDGSEATLKDVVDFYNRGGDVAENRSGVITPLGLNDQEVLDLVEFLKALEGEPLKVSMPALPGMTDANEK
ncbi:MAG: cytochrome-c peroxidase [Nitrospinaceae bacterium]|nr:cytochrome-c peroxidase [Nitrospinaceae bacterium]NIR54514.1 cytochrome-c peroxidase [Nitrospinaceae bacterium]NIS84933.1 cytochrome-c peroxidase [Nitrospinaceae bacterium]NIT81747.1 cytochrome-c peroxidase [Nitrospinaceae bacterium]NIU44016.1 cytochrome-c peroxidase [Nitrospinaceae bacterium]